MMATALVCVDKVTGGAVPTFPLHSTHVWVWGAEHSDSDELPLETQMPFVGDHYRLLESELALRQNQIFYAK